MHGRGEVFAGNDLAFIHGEDGEGFTVSKVRAELFVYGWYCDFHVCNFLIDNRFGFGLTAA
jgi:hypothetical protein